MKFMLHFAVLFLSVSSTVCGWNENKKTTTTYSSPEEEHSNGDSILHCEACGACSNPHDIQIYWDTKDTLTGTSTECAIKDLLADSFGSRCLLKKVGFTPQCHSCWMENIRCDKKKCLKTCLKMKMFGIGRSKPGQPGLDACLQCDEDECGDAFKKCAGANRRRCGIVSDIDRPTDEMCTVFDPVPAE